MPLWNRPWNHAFALTRETPAGRAAEFSRRPAGLLPTAPVCQPHPVGLLQQGNGLLSRESAPFSRTSIIVDENADSSAAWNWRRRVDASNGESGGRDVQCDGDNHGSRAAALNHRHSSFCYTCCPYAAYLAQNSVERSDERLNYKCRASEDLPKISPLDHLDQPRVALAVVSYVCA